MKLVLVTVLSLFTFTAAQEEMPKEPPAACEHPVLVKARSAGLNALTVKEIPRFWVKSILCKREAKKRGETIDFKDLYSGKRRSNFEESRKLSGIGSCCVMVSTLILFYSYWGLLMGAD